MTEPKPEDKPRRKAGRPRVPGAYRNPLPLRLSDDQLALCKEMAGQYGSMNEFIRYLVDDFDNKRKQ